jgi:hypothetical protein
MRELQFCLPYLTVTAALVCHGTARDSAAGSEQNSMLYVYNATAGSAAVVNMDLRGAGPILVPLAADRDNKSTESKTRSSMVMPWVDGARAN